jgi:hypothetical protein
MEIIDNFRKGGQYGRVKTNGIPEKKDFAFDPNYLDNLDKKIQLEKEKAEKRDKLMSESYNNWLNDGSKIELAHDHKIVNEGYVMIEIFYYVEKIETMLIVEGSSSECYYKTLPVAKVLNVGESKVLKVGDIVTISPLMSKNVLNEEWVKYQSVIREQPTMQKVLTEPPVFMGRLTEWLQYMYQLEPLKETSTNDQHTYLLPERYIQGKLK